jgi:hypothetical protein
MYFVDLFSLKVQKPVQYKYLYECVAEYLKASISNRVEPTLASMLTTTSQLTSIGYENVGDDDAYNYTYEEIPEIQF